MGDEMEVQRRPIEILGNNVKFWMKDQNLKGLVICSANDYNNKVVTGITDNEFTRRHVLGCLMALTALLEVTYKQNKDVPNFATYEEKEHVNNVIEISRKIFDENGMNWKGDKQ